MGFCGTRYAYIHCTAVILVLYRTGTGTDTGICTGPIPETAPCVCTRANGSQTAPFYDRFSQIHKFTFVEQSASEQSASDASLCV